MDIQLQIQLKKRYPNLFKQLFEHRNSRYQYSISMFGIECGDGWFDLIDLLSFRIEHLIDSLPDKEKSLYFVSQIKEKFGTLRYYMNSFNMEMEQLISIAERDSAVICETCGFTGETKLKNGLYVTACPSCTKAVFKE